jgi:aspartyl-tRNA(Asn)/glutamyl-tRNA(Gln) amidotransferase subunit B
MATAEQLAKYDMTIGIECHVQLATVSKLFSGADNDARDKEPNSVINPIDFGLPGMLPVLNHHAIELAVKAGKALNAEIAHVSRFDRKHYFYPDLPKGYQITQMYQPIIQGGHVDAPLENGETVTVRIHHAHIEEDAGKLTHYSDYSLVDLNRAGTPLIEIVSEPDIHSPAAAKAYATELHRLMTYAGVTNGDLYHGNMRFDVNISIAPKGAAELGKRAEVKNLNSFRSVEKAAEYEFNRQVELLEKGETVVQETRGFDDASGKTTSQRSKEDAQDYRYMPDADIPPVVLTKEEIDKIQAEVPNLPSFYREAWRSMELDNSVVNSLLSNREYADAILNAQMNKGDEIARPIAHWFASAADSEDDKQAALNSAEFFLDRLITLAEMFTKREISSTVAKQIFNQLRTTNIDPRQFAESNNLLQESDESAIQAIVDEILADPANAQSVKDIEAGQDKAIGFLVGQIMKKSAGKANPGLAQQLIRKKLGK